ncbi:hypothetical protein [Sphingobacterium tabacisoli]|uniref:YARHG domain-containing protein n=1 Tax=Sphingobacterium tabacisoli TaxID=2044855 RepID=A0ABW5L1F2_9SPHI|nr:hypothetical protein [Sphingobacterium tabacisoli]
MKIRNLVFALFALLIGTVGYADSYVGFDRTGVSEADSSFVVKYRYKERLAYHIYTNGDTSIVLYSTDGSTPVMSSQYKEGFGKDYLSFLSMDYKHEGLIYEVDGRMMNGGYLSFNGYKEKDSSLDKPADYYQLSDVLWEVGEYKDCKMYYHEEENNTKMRVFAFNREDDVDYNEACKAVLKMSGVPSVQLEPGWVVITADFFIDEDRQYELVGQLVKDSVDFEETVTINTRDLELLLGGTTEERIEFSNTLPHLNYCEVIGWSQSLDEKTSDYVVEFLGDMCIYFNLYGRYDLEEFQAYFLRAAMYRKDHYVKHQMLSRKQADLFYKELLEHQSSNLKENLLDF